MITSSLNHRFANSGLRLQGLQIAIPILSFLKLQQSPEKLLDELKTMYRSRYVCPFEIAPAYASLDQKKEAYEWLQKGVQGRVNCMIRLRSEPWLDRLRQDVRYRNLSNQIGLPNSPAFTEF